MKAFETVDRLLRDPLATLVSAEDRPAHTVRTLVVVIVACAAVFGAALGLFRGGLQVPFAAIKMPMVILFTACLCAPVLTCTRAALGASFALRRDLVLVLAALARTSLVVVALTPLLLLTEVLHVGYHAHILVTVGICGVAGLVGLKLLLAGIGLQKGARRAFVSATLVVAMALVGSQMAWTLRPYLVRPRTPDTPFLRSLEGSFVEAVSGSALSAGGIFRRESAPLPGGEGER